MDDESLQSVGGNIPNPPQLSPKQIELCKKLDDLHVFYGLKTHPSDLFTGAIFVSRVELRNNPDWLAQAANSLREILYPFYSREVQNTTTNKKNALGKFGSVRINDSVLIGEMGRIYGALNGLTHHGNVEKNHIDYSKYTVDEFENLLNDFENVMLELLARQVDIHKEVDNIIAAGPETGSTQDSDIPKPTI